MSEEEKRELRVQKINQDFINERINITQNDDELEHHKQLFFQFQSVIDHSALTLRTSLHVLKASLQQNSRILAEIEEEADSKQNKLTNNGGIF